jgi:RimJ/RimL family protein N-acetyltransferase
MDSLRTARLRLRPWTETDAALLADLAARRRHVIQAVLTCDEL